MSMSFKSKSEVDQWFFEFGQGDYRKVERNLVGYKKLKESGFNREFLECLQETEEGMAQFRAYALAFLPRSFIPEHSSDIVEALLERAEPENNMMMFSLKNVNMFQLLMEEPAMVMQWFEEKEIGLGAADQTVQYVFPEQPWSVDQTIELLREVFQKLLDYRFSTAYVSKLRDRVEEVHPDDLADFLAEHWDNKKKRVKANLSYGESKKEVVALIKRVTMREWGFSFHYLQHISDFWVKVIAEVKYNINTCRLHPDDQRQDQDPCDDSVQNGS